MIHVELSCPHVVTVHCISLRLQSLPERLDFATLFYVGQIASRYIYEASAVVSGLAPMNESRDK